MNGHHTGILTCDNCGRDSVHELQYAGRLLVRSVCTSCGYTAQRDGDDLWDAYIHDVEKRLASKPLRMWRRFRRHPVQYGRGLTASVLAKPMRIYRELRLVSSSGRRR
jgi:ribosomal protein L37E